MKLTGNDAVGFLESMRHPDEKQQTKLKEISKNITLRNIPNGYEADIKNLDMSFFRRKIMTFKEARKEAREIAQRTGYWGYIFKDKSGEWFTSDCNNFTSDNSFYVNKAGKILNMQKYEKIKKKLDKQGIRGLCLFSPELMKYIEQHGDY